MSHACKPFSQVLFTHPAQLSVLENAARNMHAYNQGVYNMHVLTVKSRAVYRSTIQFLTIFGVLLTETCY